MIFKNAYARSGIKNIKDLDNFLKLEMRSEFYEFLWGQGAFPNESEKMEAHSIIVFQPWKNDVFTAYKTILYSMALSYLYPQAQIGECNLFLNQEYAVREIYKVRGLIEPTEDQLKAIHSEMNRIATGYADAIIQGHLELNESKQKKEKDSKDKKIANHRVSKETITRLVGTGSLGHSQSRDI